MEDDGRTREDLQQELEKLRAELAEARQTLDAIRQGHVDALVVSTSEGDRVFTLKGADQAYRTVIEQMQEGAVTLLGDGRISYSNRCFAGMVRRPLEEIIGSHARDHVVESDRAGLEQLVRRALDGRAHGELNLQAADGTTIPVHVGMTLMVLDGLPSICMMVTDLTERKLVERVLASEQFVRAILNQAVDAIVVCDTEGRLLFTNPAARRLLQVDEQAPLATAAEMWPQIADADGGPIPPVKQALAVALRGQVVAGREKRILCPGGRQYDVLVSATPLRDADNRIMGAVATMSDITPRKQAEEAARQQHEWLRVTLSSIGDAVIATDGASRVTFLNPAAAELTGWSQEEAVSQPVERVFSVVDQRTGQTGDNIVARVLRDKRVIGVSSDTDLVTKEGRCIPVEDSAAPIVDAGGNVVGVVLVFHDVTIQRQARESLRESEQRYRLLFDRNPDGVFSVDAAGRFLLANSACETISGYSADELREMTFAQLCAPDRLADTMAHFERNIREQAYSQLETALVRKDGRRVEVWIAGEPIVAGGRVLSVYCTAKDITDRKQWEAQLQAAKDSAERAKAAAEHASRAKDHFLAVLSHELRTPLTPVVMGLAMLQGRKELDPSVRDMLEMFHGNIAMEAGLIDDLLDVTRISRGKIDLQRERVTLETVLRRAVEICRPDIEARGLHFGVDLGPAAPYWVDVDASRLQQVFWNLLKNAIKFTPNGGCVGIRCRPDRDGVLVEVEDSGIGIEPEALPRVFDAFEQAELSISRHFGGLGLGLTISKSLVEMHGGTISAHSAGRDKGATFRVRLPLTAPPDRLEAAAPAAAPRACGPLRILLVEDHGVTANMIRMVLVSEGHTVEMAADVATALRLADEQSFDLLISDLGLPDASGHQLLGELRARGHAFPGIALSGYGQEDDVERSRQAGFATHLIKPASREAVLEAVASATVRQPAG